MPQLFNRRDCFLKSWFKVKNVFITFPATWQGESVSNMVALSWDLRMRLTYRYPKFAKSECLSVSDCSIYESTSLFYKILHDYSGLGQAYMVYDSCQTSNKSTYISIPKTHARRLFPLKLFNRIFLSRADAAQ